MVEDEARSARTSSTAINVIHLDVPPLRARGGDVLLLAQHFLDRESRRARQRCVQPLAPAAAESSVSYDWPGNVRELQNCVERAVALARLRRVTVDDLPERIQRYRRPSGPAATGEPEALLTLAEIERRHILHVLEACAGNQTTAARLLGLARRTLHRKLAEYRAADPQPPAH